MSSRQRLTVLVGAPGSGTSTIARLLAERTGRELVDADADGERYYAEVGWSADRLAARAETVGFARAHDEWEVALAHAVVGLVRDQPGAVIALGAGHTHVRDASLRGRVADALATADEVVLLRPSLDVETTLDVLQTRCVRDKGTRWVVEGDDWLRRWVTDGLDELLATRVLVTGDETPEQTVSRLVALR